MKIIQSLFFRVRRLLGVSYSGRPDVIPAAQMRKWSRAQKNCAIEPDFRVQGRADALHRIELGSGCAIDPGCIVWIAAESAATPSISLGNRVYLGPYCFLGSYAPLTIGDETIIGAYSYIITANHRMHPDRPVRDQDYDAAPITIGRDVWIGCHVTVLPGVTIGDQAVIGAGAVVNRDVPAGETWGGVPAKKIGVRVPNASPPIDANGET